MRDIETQGMRQCSLQGSVNPENCISFSIWFSSWHIGYICLLNITIVYFWNNISYLFNAGNIYTDTELCFLWLSLAQNSTSFSPSNSSPLILLTVTRQGSGVSLCFPSLLSTTFISPMSSSDLTAINSTLMLIASNLYFWPGLHPALHTHMASCPLDLSALIGNEQLKCDIPQVLLWILPPIANPFWLYSLNWETMQQLLVTFLNTFCCFGLSWCVSCIMWSQWSSRACSFFLVLHPLTDHQLPSLCKTAALWPQAPHSSV